MSQRPGGNPPCPQCSGQKKVRCGCGGTGWRACGACNGRGTYGESELIDGGYGGTRWVQKRCRSCDGSGEFRCYHDSQGLVVCPRCEGSGEISNFEVAWNNLLGHAYRFIAVCAVLGAVLWIVSSLSPPSPESTPPDPAPAVETSGGGNEPAAPTGGNEPTTPSEPTTPTGDNGPATSTTGGAGSTDTEAAWPCTIVSSKDHFLTLRAGPGADADRLTDLPDGTHFRPIQKSNKPGWYYVGIEGNEQKGWVHAADFSVCAEGAKDNLPFGDTPIGETPSSETSQPTPSLDSKQTGDPTVTVTLCLESGKLATRYCPDTIQRKMTTSEVPSEVCDRHGPAGSVQSQQDSTLNPRQFRVNVHVPQGNDPQQIRIEVTDDTGTHVEYSGEHRPGDELSEIVSGNGDHIILRVYSDGQVIHKESIPRGGG